MTTVFFELICAQKGPNINIIDVDRPKSEEGVLAASDEFSLKSKQIHSP